MAPSIGTRLRQAREVRELSAVDAARAAGISAAYLSRLENDAVKKPSPLVLHQLSEALGVPYSDLMRLSGYRVPGESRETEGVAIGTALFANLTEDEREELLDTSPGIGPGADQGPACVAGGDTVRCGSPSPRGRSYLSTSLLTGLAAAFRSSDAAPEPPRRSRSPRPRPRSGCPSAGSRPANARPCAARGRIRRPGARAGGPPVRGELRPVDGELLLREAQA